MTLTEIIATLKDHRDRLILDADVLEDRFGAGHELTSAAEQRAIEADDLLTVLTAERAELQRILHRT